MNMEILEEILEYCGKKVAVVLKTPLAVPGGAAVSMITCFNDGAGISKKADFVALEPAQPISVGLTAGAHILLPYEQIAYIIDA